VGSSRHAAAEQALDLGRAIGSGRVIERLGELDTSGRGKA
jgi:hypothetical protein